MLIGMSGSDSLIDLKELIEPIKQHLDGVVWVLHDSRDGPEDQYLESVKGAGAVHYAHYCHRHDFSRNLGLYWGPLTEDCWCIGADSLERISPLFAANARRLIADMDGAGINAAFYYGKHFMFRYHESIRYQGNPHEGLTRDDGQMRAIDLKDHLPVETDVRYGVRAAKRDPLHWLFHYGRYYLSTPWGANHCLLGNVDRGDEMAIYRAREKVRLELRGYLRSVGAPFTVDGFKAYVVANPRDPTILRLCSVEKITNDLYRHFVLGDTTINDNHHWRDLKDLT